MRKFADAIGISLSTMWEWEQRYRRTVAPKPTAGWIWANRDDHFEPIMLFIYGERWKTIPDDPELWDACVGNEFVRRNLRGGGPFVN
jgi:hypothetical protein